jgi:zinc finger protein 830
VVGGGNAQFALTAAAGKAGCSCLALSGPSFHLLPSLPSHRPPQREEPLGVLVSRHAACGDINSHRFASCLSRYCTLCCIGLLYSNNTIAYTTPHNNNTMAEDPRALLRAARKERRVTHPHASYTSTGNLLCNLCEVPIKSQAAWGAHLHSTGHTLRLSREQDAAIARKAETGNGKKRKACSPEDGEESDGEDRKRVKPSDATAATPVRPVTAESVSAPEPAPTSANDEQAEMDALEADLAALERESRANAAVVSNTISAPAQSAEDIAAQAREDQSAQRGRRDIELEEEKEEAARALEDEFAEMQTLENRVKKLREKRELLRAGKLEQAIEGAKTVAAEDGGGGANGSVDLVQTEEKSIVNSEQDDEDEDDDDEEFDDWTFGAR